MHVYAIARRSHRYHTEDLLNDFHTPRLFRVERDM
jgi:hypothetical protein